MSSETPPTRSGQPKLSEVARHLVLPSGIVSTGWPAVAAKLKSLGLKFDPWQQGAARCILAKRADGSYAATIGGVVISIARQVGKTFLIGAIVFALCMIFPGLTALWTAHRVRTSNETFRSMQGMAKRKLIAPFVSRVTTGAGTQAVEFTNGSRIMFGARERGFGRGFPGVSLLIFDEAQILTESALEDMVPAANQGTNPLIIFMGTPPRTTDPGEVFTSRRAEALSGESEDTLYIEISADPETDPSLWKPGCVDWGQVVKANPSYPLRTPRASILRMIKQLKKPDSIRREVFGVWDEAPKGLGVIPPASWSECLVPDSVIVGDPTLVLDCSPMLTRACIVAAGAAEDGRTHVEITGARGLLDCREGVDWAVDLLGSAQVSVTIAAGSSAEALVSRLEEAGARVSVMSKPDYAAACVSFAAAVAGGQVVHRGQKDLDRAVLAGVKRAADEGLWTWGRVKSSEDITPLVAATVAYACTGSTYDVLASVR